MGSASLPELGFIPKNPSPGQRQRSVSDAVRSIADGVFFHHSHALPAAGRTRRRPGARHEPQGSGPQEKGRGLLDCTRKPDCKERGCLLPKRSMKCHSRIDKSNPAQD